MGLSPAPLIRCDVPGTFAWGVFHDRHPVLVRRVLEAFPYGPAERAAFAALLDESRTGSVPDRPLPGPDAAEWDAWRADAVGTPWPRLQFLWAESYFFRRLLDASGYFGDGAGRGVDPFAAFKRADLHGPEAQAELADLDPAPGGPRGADRERALLHAAVWGNQADLAFAMTSEGAGPEASGLIADESDALWDLLDGGRTAYVADNSGRELIADLALVDHLLDSGRASSLDLLVKPYPCFVSDATPADVFACLRRVDAAAARLGARLRAAMGDGRLRVRVHPFAGAPLPYSRMPADLRDLFAAARVTVMKGDLNYRRLADDRYWPADTPFGDVTAYFPGPLATLRTVKSDVVVGLDSGTAAALDAADPGWRFEGTHAVVQVRA